MSLFDLGGRASRGAMTRTLGTVRLARAGTIPKVSMGSHLPQLELRAQIAALGIGGVLTLGIISILGTQTQERFQRDVNQSAQLKEKISAVAGDLLTARQVETDFLLQRKDALIIRRQDLVTQAGQRLG